MKEKESLAKRETDLHEQEKVTRGELDTTSESSNTVYAKCDEVVASVSVDKGSIRVGKMMEKANTAYIQEVLICFKHTYVISHLLIFTLELLQ